MKEITQKDQQKVEISALSHWGLLSRSVPF
jgi:hypothetical protein